MPEVVEITLTSNYLDSKLKGFDIIKINVLGGRYYHHSNSLKGLDEFKKKLPLTVKHVNSKGKFLWFELNSGCFVMNTFGLSGEWGFTKKLHSNVEFKLSNDKSVYFTDSRNFGTIIMTTDKQLLQNKLNSLGPDLLKTDFTDNMFYNYVKNYLYNKTGANSKINETKKNKKIVQVLMNQTINGGFGSGLGNYLAVEILFHAKISPHTKIYKIYQDRNLCDTLANSIRYITKLSYMTAEIGYLSDTHSDIGKWIKQLRIKINNNAKHKFNYHPTTKIGRAKFKFKVYRQILDPDNNNITAEKGIIIGRTTYWSPSVQK
jgi:formamidopyrimidine-DNA glycosylase